MTSESAPADLVRQALAGLDPKRSEAARRAHADLVARYGHLVAPGSYAEARVKVAVTLGHWQNTSGQYRR
jgi:hypothetical protein